MAAAKQGIIEFPLGFYGGWTALIDGTEVTGTDFEIDFDTIVEYLNEGLLTTPGICRKNEPFRSVFSIGPLR
jgi:hypothetical protein